MKDEIYIVVPAAKIRRKARADREVLLKYSREPVCGLQPTTVSSR